MLELVKEGGMRKKWPSERACAYRRCRTGAQPGSDWCKAHPEGKPRTLGGAPQGNQNARTHGMQSRPAPAAPMTSTQQAPALDLGREIAAARRAIEAVMDQGLEPNELVKALNIGTATLTRLLKTHKLLEERNGEIQQGLEQALIELGLG
jgi:hypothetical protein